MLHVHSDCAHEEIHEFLARSVPHTSELQVPKRGETARSGLVQLNMSWLGAARKHEEDHVPVMQSNWRVSAATDYNPSTAQLPDR